MNEWLLFMLDNGLAFICIIGIIIGANLLVEDRGQRMLNEPGVSSGEVAARIANKAFGWFVVMMSFLALIIIMKF